LVSLGILGAIGLGCAGGGAGGAAGSGGAAETGGATGAGGSTGSGGAKASGGATGGGGVTGAGGVQGRGGATATGGASACASCQLMVAAQCQTGSDTQTIRVTVDVEDAAITPLALADVTFRYWFVMNTPTDTPMLTIDYAQISQTAGATITSKFAAVSPARTGANEYLEVGFAASAPTLTLFGDTGQIQLHLHTASYSSFDPNPTSDYSYRACAGGDTGNTYAAALTITGYVNGQLAWGTEPQ
jgi:hypothetical protein